jgi:integrase
MAAQLLCTAVPGVYRRGSRFVVIDREDGRQRKQAVATFAEARELKMRRRAAVITARRGPTLHFYALHRVDRHAGNGHDVVTERTRTEYRRLLITYAFAYYFDSSFRMRDLDRFALQGFVNWLTQQPGPSGRLSDHSVRNALLPLRACLRAAVADGTIAADPTTRLLLPRRRGGKPYEFEERRFLTRKQLARFLDEIPSEWRPLFDLLAATGLRISEAVGLRVMDLALGSDPPRVHVRRVIVQAQVTTPKSRHGVRTIPLTPSLASDLATLAAGRDEREPLFQGRRGAPLRPNNLRIRVVMPAAERAGVPLARFHTLRHTCASLLAEAGAGPVRLQRWMGHHSASYTLDTYGHLIDGDLGPALDLEAQLPVTAA